MPRISPAVSYQTFIQLSHRFSSRSLPRWGVLAGVPKCPPSGDVHRFPPLRQPEPSPLGHNLKSAVRFGPLLGGDDRTQDDSLRVCLVWVGVGRRAVPDAIQCSPGHFSAVDNSTLCLRALGEGQQLQLPPLLRSRVPLPGSLRAKGPPESTPRAGWVFLVPLTDSGFKLEGQGWVFAPLCRRSLPTHLPPHFLPTTFCHSGSSRAGALPARRSPSAPWCFSTVSRCLRFTSHNRRAAFKCKSIGLFFR